jgi:MFS family permease
MHTQTTSSSTFYGWRIVVASFFTLGIAVGLPYFSVPFFYDYFERPLSAGGFGWPRSAMMLGLPIGTLATVWVGPLLAHRFPPRRLILAGTGLTALTLIGFGRMNGSLWMYWLLWISYMIGNVFSGGLTHQVILSHWFVRQRGTALSIAYLGISVIGAVSARFIVPPLVAAFGFRLALQLMGCLLFLTWPLVLWVLRERPAELGLQPDGDAATDAAAQAAVSVLTYRELLRQRAFWVLLLGGSCLVGAVGALSQHLKLILKDGGFNEQQQLDLAFSQTLSLLLIISAVSRLGAGRLADRWPKRHVLTLQVALLSAALPWLLWLQPPQPPYLFALFFGLAVGGDFLLIALLTADYYDVHSLGRVLAILLPVMTVGQTWFPFLIALLREASGSYALPLWLILIVALGGRALLSGLPALPDSKGKPA